MKTLHRRQRLSPVRCRINVGTRIAGRIGRASISAFIRARVSADFGIKHMTIQMETTCCHPGEIHCDLTTLAKQHQDEGLLHVHH